MIAVRGRRNRDVAHRRSKLSGRQLCARGALRNATLRQLASKHLRYRIGTAQGLEAAEPETAGLVLVNNICESEFARKIRKFNQRCRLVSRPARYFGESRRKTFPGEDVLKPVGIALVRSGCALVDDHICKLAQGEALSLFVSLVDAIPLLSRRTIGIVRPVCGWAGPFRRYPQGDLNPQSLTSFTMARSLHLRYRRLVTRPEMRSSGPKTKASVPAERAD